MSSEALCILTGLIPIAIKPEEVVKLYHLTRGSKKENETIDHDWAIKLWLHPAETTTILNVKNEDKSSLQIFTDGSKTEQRVGAG